MPVKKGSKQPKKYIDPNDDNDIYNSEEEYASKSSASSESGSGKSSEGTNDDDDDDDDDETTATTESDDTDIVSEYSGEFEDTEETDDDDDDDDETTQSGGDSDEGSENEVASTELGDDSNSLDTDPDEEMDQVDDDKYDPINDAEEVEDADVESIESVGGDENDENEGNDEGEENEDRGIGEDGDGDGDPDGDGYTGETKQCHLKNLNKDFIVLDEDDSNMYGKMEYKRIADEDRESDNIMTYYEMVRVIGTRAQQFNFEAPPLVKGLSGLHVAKMAYIELIAKMTPYIIRRHLPGKKYEEWRIDELDIIHKITDDFFVPENFDWDALMKQAADLNKYKKEQIQIKTSKKKNKKN